MSSKEKKQNSVIHFILSEFEMLVILPALGYILFQRIAGVAQGFDSNAFFALLIGLAARVVRLKYQSDQLKTEVSKSLNVISDDLSLARSEISESFSGSLLHQAERCNRAQFYRRMLSALSESSATVDLTQFDPYPPQHFGTEEMEEYFSAQERKVINEPKVIFRRIVGIPTLEKLEWVLDFLDKIGECPNFHVSAIDLTLNSELPPPLSLQIFDRKQVCLVDPTRGQMKAAQQNNMLWCRGDAIAEVFHIYYRELYNKATILKEGPIIYWDQILETAQKLKKQHPSKSDLADKLILRVCEAGGMNPPNTRKKK